MAPAQIALRNHPLRRSLSEEMHIRKLPPFAAPARLLQIVVQVDEDAAAAERAGVDALLAGRQPESASGSRYLQCRLGEIHFVWERHTEFSTYTFIRAGEFDAALGTEPFAALPDGWFDRIVGAVVRATLIAVVTPGSPLVEAAAVAALFEEHDLVACDLAGGAAQLWSDFRLKPDGFGRLLIADHSLAGDELSSLVQRVQELGNYRNMALLGLPIAQRLTPEVSRLEQRLTQVTDALARADSDDERLLGDISALSAELARLMADTRYRMAATRAYADLTQDRLASLGVGKIKGFPTLADFTDRRLAPATRTCASFSTRLEDLAQRLAWTSALLRTRVDTALSRQNRDLLASMDRRTDLQLRLQHTVESLSVVAISYYVIGLLGYLVKAAHVYAAGLPVELIQGIAVPVIGAVIWLWMRRVRRRLEHD